MKSGWKSSEFWILLIVIVLTNIQASGLLEATSWPMKIATVVVNVLGVLGYTAARAQLKVASIGSGPASPPPIPASPAG